MKIPYFCCIGAELKRYAKDFDFMNQVYLYKVPTDDSIDEVLAEDYFKAISDSVLQDDIVYIYEASAETLHSCRFDKQNGHITAIPLASDETLTGAVTTIIHDNLTKNRAVISNSDGKVAVSEVTSTELGYLSGAKSNIQTQLDGKAGAYEYASNCITEIPQDIAILRSSGSLILKSGSKVYIPNGSGVFTPTIIANDLTNTGFGVGAFIITNGTAIVGSSEASSGATAPANPNNGAIWYDTTNNVVKRYSTSSSSWVGGFSLPVGIVVSSDEAKVFNGFGYIGSILFSLPHCKGLAPNGRNADGTLNNNIINDSSVRTYTLSGTYNFMLVKTANGIGTYFYAYDPVNNYIYRTDTGARYGGDRYIFGSCRVESGVIKSFSTKQPFHAVGYSDTEFIGHQATPSGRYMNLTLPAGGETVTAPADGWICLNKVSGNANEFARLSLVANGMATSAVAPDADRTININLPVSKGDVVKVLYNLSGRTNGFFFVYANGAK